MISCNTCWSNPCSCGKLYENMTSDQILSMIDNLKKALNKKLLEEKLNNDSWKR